jgi:hypothetical protein
VQKIFLLKTNEVRDQHHFPKIIAYFKQWASTLKLKQGDSLLVSVQFRMEGSRERGREAGRERERERKGEREKERESKTNNLDCCLYMKHAKNNIAPEPITN